MFDPVYPLPFSLSLYLSLSLSLSLFLSLSLSFSLPSETPPSSLIGNLQDSLLRGLARVNALGRCAPEILFISLNLNAHSASMCYTSGDPGVVLLTSAVRAELFTVECDSLASTVQRLGRAWPRNGRHSGVKCSA